MLRRSKGRLRAARSLQAAVIVVVASSAAGLTWSAATDEGASRASEVTASVPQTAPPDCSQQPFCGDYETGNLTQWAFRPMEGDSSITIGTAATQPVKQGLYSAKFV